jgi:kinesin family protein 2/24
VKGLSKNNNSKKDLSCTAPMQREATTSLPPLPIPAQLTPQVPDYVLENRAAENGQYPSFDPGWYSQHVECDELNNQSKECTFSGRDDSRPSYDSRALSATSEKDMSSHVDMREGGLYELHGAEFHETERVQVVLPSRRKVGREEKVERQFSRDDLVKPESVSRRQNGEQLPSTIAHPRVDSEVDILEFNHEGHINAILEEEEKVISAHRKEVEDTMEIVREEMKLLAEVDQPGSRIDHYVSELNYVLSQKAAGIVNLQARLARFQRHLKEQEILSRTGGIRQM